MSADVFDDFESDHIETTRETMSKVWDQIEEEKRDRIERKRKHKSLLLECFSTMPTILASLKKAKRNDDAGLFAYYYNLYMILEQIIEDGMQTKISVLEKFLAFPLPVEDNQWEEYILKLVRLEQDLEINFSNEKYSNGIILTRHVLNYIESKKKHSLFIKIRRTK